MPVCPPVGCAAADIPCGKWIKYMFAGESDAAAPKSSRSVERIWQVSGIELSNSPAAFTRERIAWTGAGFAAEAGGDHDQRAAGGRRLHRAQE